MKPLLVGSRALEIVCTDFKARPNSDYDLITAEDIDFAECHSPDVLLNSELQRYVVSEARINGISVDVVGLTGLSIIKRSHLHRDLAFDKHITHYVKHLKVPYSDQDRDYLERRTKETLKHFKTSAISLKKSVKEFFDDYVPKKYEHDIIHEMVAYYDKPLYSRMQENPELAWCDKKSWDLFSDSDKTKTVAEETYVIAIERFMVPKDWNYPPKLAYLNALRKVCTTLTSGWFRDWAIDHYEDVVNLFDVSKFNHVKGKLP